MLVFTIPDKDLKKYLAFKCLWRNECIALHVMLSSCYLFCDFSFVSLENF